MTSPFKSFDRELNELKQELADLQGAGAAIDPAVERLLTQCKETSEKANQLLNEKQQIERDERPNPK